MREELTPLKLSQWNYYTRTLRDNVKKFNINPTDLDRNAPIVVNGVRYNTGQDYTNAVLRETIPQKEGNLTIGDISSVQRLFNTMVNSAFENNDQQFIDSHLKYVVRDLGMGPGRLSAEDGRVGSLTMNYNFPVNAAVAGASGTTVKTPFESEKNPPMEFYFPKSMQSYDNLKFEPFQMKRAGGVTQDITRLKLEKGGRMDGSIEVENGGSAKKIGSNPDEKKIQGRSHAKGGVDVTHKSGKKYELEGGEVVDGDRVFSAKLQNSEGVTFAAAAEDLLKAKKKAEMALRVASVHTKDKIRKKVREIESSLTALFEEQQAMNGDSTGEYAQEGTDMGGTPVAGSPTGGGPGNPISSLYNTLQGTRLKDLFISEGDLLTSLNKDPQGVVNAIRSDQDAFNKIAPVFTQSFPDLAKQIGISPGVMEDVSKKKVPGSQEIYSEVTPGVEFDQKIAMANIAEDKSNIDFASEVIGSDYNEVLKLIKDKDKYGGDYSLVPVDQKIKDKAIQLSNRFGGDIEATESYAKLASYKNRKEDNSKFSEIILEKIKPLERDIYNQAERRMGVSTVSGVSVAGVENTQEFSNKIDELISESIANGDMPNISDSQRAEVKQSLIGSYKANNLFKDAFGRAEFKETSQFVKYGDMEVFKDEIYQGEGDPTRYKYQNIEEALAPLKDKNKASYDKAIQAWNNGDQVIINQDLSVTTQKPLPSIDRVDKDVEELFSKYENLLKSASDTAMLNTQAYSEYEKELEGFKSRSEIIMLQTQSQLQDMLNVGVIDEEHANAELQRVSGELYGESMSLYNNYSKKINEQAQELFNKRASELESQLGKDRDAIAKKYGLKNLEEISKRIYASAESEFKGMVSTEQRLQKMKDAELYIKRGDLKNVGAELTRGVLQMSESISGMMSWLGMNDAADAINNKAREYSAEFRPIDVGEFGLAQLLNRDWWISRAVPMVPFTASLMVPGLGASRAAGLAGRALGLTGLRLGAFQGIAAATATRPLESFMEAGLTFNEAIQRGLTYDEAADKATNVFSENMKLLLSDFVQGTILFSKLGLARGIKAGFGKAVSTTALEGSEEVFQEYSTEKQFNPSITLLQYAGSNQGLEVFTLGAISGLMFGGPEIMSDIMNNPSQYEKWQRKSIVDMIENTQLGQSIDERAVQLISMLQQMGIRGQLSADEVKEYTADVESMANTLMSLPKTMTRNEKVFAVEAISQVKAIEYLIANTPNMPDPIKKAYEARIKDAQKYIQDLMGGTDATGYMLGGIPLSKEEFLSKLENGDVSRAIKNGTLDVFVQNDEEVSNLLKEKYATETTKEPVQEGVQPSGISEYQGAEGRQPQEGEGERRIGQAEVGQADRGDRIVGRQEVQEKVDNLPATGEVLRTESVSVPTEKTGTFINVGLKVGKTDELLTEEEIKSKLPEGVEMIQATRVEPDSGLVSEPTMSIELSRPLTDSEMSKLLEDTQQLAIPQMSGTTGVMYGTTDWGPFNGYYFVTPDGNRVLATDPTMPDLQGRDFTSENADELATISENVPEGVGRKIVRDMGNVLKALSNIGGVSGTIHTTEEAYLDVLRKDGYTEEEISEAKGSSGFYEDRSGRIHINLPFVQSNTVFHEGAHPVLNAIFAQSPKAVDRLHGQLVKLAKRDKNVADVISWSKQYTGDRTIKNEAVTEFVARVADGQIDIKKSKSLLSLAKDIINEFLSILGSTRVVSNTNEIIEVAKQISESFKEGRAIELEKLKVRGVKAKPKAEAAPEVKGVPLEQKPQATQVEDVKEFIDTNDTPQPIEKGGVQMQKPKKGETLVPKSYKIDTDGKGNFLFYHYGEIKGDNIDPKYFGKNRYTSDKRSNAVSYFYTRSNEQESMVGGPVNIVKVPIEKVYPFNADPLNLVDEAEANFRKDSPTGAFDAVKQIDYMNPLIRREGFDMMVAKWSEFPLRAETTKALPIDKTLTRKMRDFGGLKVKDMLDKFSTDIANKLSDIANTIGPKQEKVRDRFYKLGGSRASTAKLMKDPVLRAAVGKTMFEKWNNLQPEEKKIQFQKPAEKQETYTDPLGNEKPMWTVKGGFTIREVDHLGDRIFVIERYGTMWGVAETLSQAERQISDRVLFQLPDKKFGETINRVYNAGNEIEKMIIDGSSDFDFTPQNHRFANDIADNILADAVANNNLMETLEGLRRTAEGSKNIGAATKIFTLLKIRDHAIKFGLTDVLKETLAQLDGISSYAARTLRALVTTAIPESIEYGATSRVRKVRDRMLKGNPKTAEAFKKISQKFPGLIESIGESIDEMTSEDAIVKLIDKAIQDGNVMPILKAAMADAKGKSQEEIDQIMADLEAEIESLNNQISTISQQLAASTIQNARANNQPATAPNTPASPQNRSPRNIPTPQQFTSLEKLAIAAYKLGYVNEQAFADKIRYEAYKAGLFLTDIEIKTLYDSTRQNIDIVELLAKGKRGLPKGQEMASSAVNTMIRTVLRKNIQAIAKSHFSTVGKLTSSLSSTIQAVFGTGPDAQAIATKIQEKFNEKVRTTATNFIAKNILSSKIPESSRIKEAQAISKKMLDRINAAVNAGVFDEQSFLDAFAEAYGFTSLTMEDRMNLKDYAYVLEYLPAESLERKKFFALFENYITRKERENAPLSTVAALWLETRYINMLGQFSTILRANKGLIFTSIAEAGVEIIMQLGKKGGLRSIAGAFSDALRATRDQGFDSLKQYIRDGVGQTTKFEPISIGQLQEIYNRGMSSDEKFGFFAELFGKGKKRTLFGKAVRGTGNVYHYLPAMFTRLIGVGDALGKPALKAFYARIAAHNALLREGLDPTDQKFFDRLTQLLKRDEGDIRLAKDAAERELQMMQDPLIADKMKKLGLKPSKNFVRNRTYEILDSQRESYIEEYSESMQARSRLMGKPYGKAGAAYDWIANGVRKFPALSVFVPFLRVPSNAMVEWYRWSPIGLLDVSVRQIPSVKMKKEIGRIIPKPVEALSETERMIEEREDLRDAIKGALGTVLALAPMFYAASLDPDDEDESYANLAFKVTGGGPAGLTFAEIQQLEELGLYRRNSIRFKTKGFDTGWIDYRDMPFAWVLSSSGFVMDRKYFGTSEKKKEFISKNEWIQATEGVASSAFFFKEQSYLSGLLQLGDIMGGSRSNYDGPQLEASASSGGKFLIDLLRTSVYPGLYRQSYVMAKPYLPEEYGVVYRPYKFSDEGVPMSTVILQELAKDVPYFEQFIGRRAYDIWGQDVEVTVTKNPLMDAIVSNILWKVFLPNTPAEYLDAGFKKKMDDPVNSYFNKRGIPLPVISNLSGVDASVNDKYKRKVGQELYKMLKPDIESKKVAKPLAGGEVPGLGSVDEDGKYKMSVKSAEIKINELLKLAKEKAKAQMPELKEVSEDDRVASYIEQITGVQFGTTPTGRTKAKSTKPKSPTKSKKQK